MSLEVALAVVTDFLIVASAVSGLLFVVLYQFRAKWWTSAIGRHMMAFMGGLEVLLLLALTSLFWPHMPGRPYLRAVSWFVVFFLFAWRTIIMITSTRHEDTRITDEVIDEEIKRLERLRTK